MGTVLVGLKSELLALGQTWGLLSADAWLVAGFGGPLHTISDTCARGEGLGNYGVQCS